MAFCNQIYVLDLKSLNWRKVFQRQPPEPRENPIFTANQLNRSMYLLGGVDHEKVFSLANFYLCDMAEAISDLSEIHKSDEQVQIEIEWHKNHFKMVSDLALYILHSILEFSLEKTRMTIQVNCSTKEMALQEFGSVFVEENNQLFVFGGHFPNKDLTNNFLLLDFDNLSIQKLDLLRKNQQFIHPRLYPVSQAPTD